MHRKASLSIILIVGISAILVIYYLTTIFDQPLLSQGKEAIRDEEVLKKVAGIQNNVKMGLSEEEVIDLFGDDYVLVDHNGDLETGLDQYWKYRFYKDENYHPSVPDHVIDEDGLRSGMIGVELLIGWKDKHVSLYTIAYTQEPYQDLYFFVNDKGMIREEVMKPDGTTQIIKPGNTDQ
ncbi:hypothetical protein LOK74_17340 [Brevibacillus humidisoli]|uniref:hypothetical protein n=1 Tax=Brevibacillus humidisoli TaxID=2895522 RepID=UPI001E54305F|nr:hypothetical protein [Brevibacillus humidisoli]UFJ39798.1 hypothetical protein LOK74_17340 [Brevibacillus humidisoli]